MKIGLFADSHFSTKKVSCSTRRPSLSFEKIRSALDAFSEVQLMICLGDLTDDCENPADNPEALDRIMELIRSCGVPFYCLRGNHDCDAFSEEEFYADSDAKPPFLLKYDGRGLIFLNANYSSYERPYEKGSVDWTDTLLPSGQVKRLEETLTDPEIRDAYIFIHQNLDPNVQYQHIVRNAAEVRRVLEASGKVRKVIQGHYHPGMDSVVNGIAYHTLPAMCEGERNYFEIMDI